ncbi:hypothetical protein XMIN_6 [Xanthomonas citri pv. mangiferaeindicae LMG 941]|nr:hypothetical protein XMIN_6 [Xanthomonas citri pv. mangiferaeindicae LMG 941]
MAVGAAWQRAQAWRLGCQGDIALLCCRRRHGPMRAGQRPYRPWRRLRAAANAGGEAAWFSRRRRVWLDAICHRPDDGRPRAAWSCRRVVRLRRPGLFNGWT